MAIPLNVIIHRYEEDAIGTGIYKTAEQFKAILNATCDHYKISRIDTNNYKKMSDAQAQILGTALEFSTGDMLRMFSMLREVRRKAGIEISKVPLVPDKQLKDFLGGIHKRFNNLDDIPDDALEPEKDSTTPLAVHRALNNPDNTNDAPVIEKEIATPLVMPAVLKNLKSNQTALNILERKLKKGETFQAFIQDLLAEWDITRADLSKIVAYNYQKETGKEGSVSETSLRDWSKLSEGEDAPKLKLWPDSLKIFRIGLNMDEQDEMRMWRLIGGHYSHTLPDLIAKAKTGETGPLVTELVEASGISAANLEALIPSKGVDEWMKGSKIRKPETAVRFLDLVYPAKRYSRDAEDPMRVAQRKEILEALEYAPTKAAEGPRPPRVKITQDDPELIARVDGTIAQIPLGPQLEAGFSEGKSWQEIIQAVGDTWKVSPQQWSEHIARKHSEHETITFSSIYEWQKGSIKHVSNETLSILKDAHQLNDIQEKIIWKTANGRRLAAGELEQTLETSRKEGHPAAIVNLLYPSSGIGETRFKEMMGSEIQKWKTGGRLKSAATANNFIDATMATELLWMDETQRQVFEEQTRPKLLKLLTGRSQSISDILENDGPANAADLIDKLSSMHGIKPLNKAEFAKVIGLRTDSDGPEKGGHQVAEFRTGRKVMSHEQQHMLLAHYGCTEGPNFEKSMALLSTKTPANGRSRIQPKKPESE